MRRVFHEVMTSHDLDALAFPQAIRETPSINGAVRIDASTVAEINMLGMPGVTVPAGYYPSGAPFGMIFLGDDFTEAELLGYAYDYERQRRPDGISIIGERRFQRERPI